MSNRDFGALIKQELRRVTGDHRLTRRSIAGVGTKAPVKTKPWLKWARLSFRFSGQERELFVVYKPSPERC